MISEHQQFLILVFERTYLDVILRLASLFEEWAHSIKE